MPVIDVINQNAEKVSQITLSEEIFCVPVKKTVLHDMVKTQLTNRRAGCAKVKRRSEVRGSSRKLFRQKGTGRARRGDIRSPLLRGGGVVFGPTPKKYSAKLPKKVRRLALKMALSSKLNDAQLLILDQIVIDEAKTRKFSKLLQTLNIENALFILDKDDPHVTLSSRNIPGVTVMLNEGLNVLDILKHQHLVLVEGSIAAIERRLQVS